MEYSVPSQLPAYEKCSPLSFSSTLLSVHAGNSLLAEGAVPGTALAFWGFLFASCCYESIVLKEALNPHLTNAPSPAACQAHCASSGCPHLAAEHEPWQCRRPDSKANSHHLVCPSPTSITLHSINLPLHTFSTFGSCRISTNARISGMSPGAGKRNNPRFICIYIKTEIDRVPRRSQTSPFQDASLSFPRLTASGESPPQPPMGLGAMLGPATALAGAGKDALGPGGGCAQFQLALPFPPAKAVAGGRAGGMFFAVKPYSF